MPRVPREDRLDGLVARVVLSSRENADPSPDPKVLAALASMTGGTAVDLANVADLLDELPGGEERREPISSRLEDAWDRWATSRTSSAVSTLWLSAPSDSSRTTRRPCRLSSSWSAK